MTKPKPASPWRSVKDEPPPLRFPVFCYGDLGRLPYVAALSEGPDGPMWLSVTGHKNLRPSHWMPIPSLPAEQEAK